MNPVNKTDLSIQQTTNLEEKTFEKELDSFNKQRSRNEKIKIQIKFTSDQKIIYSLNGKVLRMYILSTTQIKEQKAQIALRNQKFLIMWIKSTIFNGMVNTINTKRKKVSGLLFGINNLQIMLKDKVQLFLIFYTINKGRSKEYGKIYYNEIRIGRWNYLQWDRKIYGGSYNQNGQKQGKWGEVDEGFYDFKRITYFGEYNMNNMKVGRWDIMYCKYDEKQYKQIGGGSYDQEGNQKKIGEWVELFEGFQNSAQITYNGQYNINSMKIGRWDIMYDRDKDGKQFIRIFKYKYIGGGSYDQEGNQKKIGKWVELDEKFNCWKQVIYNGEYNMKGQKVGIWVEMDIEVNKKRGEKKYNN